MNISRIDDYFSNTNLDIRVKGNNPRFIDQKCTPDVLSFIADCIINLDKDKFIRDDIWNLEYFKKNAVLIFNKPSPSNVKVSNEYDKFISQPLDLLSYAGILIKNKSGNKNEFKLNNDTLDILEYIAMRDRNAYFFLLSYLSKVLTDSNFMKHIDYFITYQSTEAYNLLKSKFEQFLIGNSNIGNRGSSNGGKVEARRIFSKVINIFAVANNSLGTERGHLSKSIITYQDLMYNEINFRDLGKLKNVSRKEEKEKRLSSPQKYNKFLIQKAMQWIRRHHHYSEVNDNMYGPTAEVHHIFPKKDFYEISGYIENLIALTAGQHKDKAHPKSNGNEIDLMYQCVCLRAKNKTIQKELQSGEPSQYSKHDFIYVINTGFKKADFVPSNSTFEEIDDLICQYYKIAN
ncbi:MAG: hypothetical protein SO206_03535 [Bacilli bacterium]|nr:hypothetical protein [Bacilli bacterium]